MEEIRSLALEARSEGFRFMERLCVEMESGENRFDKPGEALFGIYESEELLAVGGLNIDTYASDERVGRVRRVYVRPSRRMYGLGVLLLGTIVEHAKPNFDLLTLRTDSETASAFFYSLGFENEPPGNNYTHYLRLADTETSQ
jgi:GNAT superfamily N-acetyltransferase